MNKKWYTLVELMVWVAIIMFLILWMVNINFTSVSDSQKIEIFSLKVLSEIETVRTNSLIWKWIWEDLIVPNLWKIDFSKTWSWYIETFYSTWTLADENWTSYNNIFFDNFFEIYSISCWKINNSLTDISGTWTILFQWNDISLKNDCDWKQLLNLNLKYKIYEKEIDFNTVNWLIKVK